LLFISLNVLLQKSCFQFLLLDIEIAQTSHKGSVATVHLRSGGVFSGNIIRNFLLILIAKKSLKIGQYVSKL